MISRWLRRHMHVLTPSLLWAARWGISPNLLTFLSLLSIAISGFILAGGHLPWGGAVLLFGSLLDAIDGELARVLKRDTPRGALLDSLADHCGDMAVFLGLLWSYLNRHVTTEVVLIFLALFGSMLGSQVRSRAAMVGVETKSVGVSTRFERMLILIVGLFAGEVTAALWILAVLNNFSALQRIVSVVRPFSSRPLSPLLPRGGRSRWGG